MKYTYKFADGTSAEVDVVSDEMAAELKEQDRLEYNNNQTETRRHASLEAFNLDGGLFPSEMDVEAEIQLKEQTSNLHTAIKKLSQSQQGLVNAVYFRGISVSEYAKLRGVAQPAISQRLKTVYKRLKISNQMNL